MHNIYKWGESSQNAAKTAKIICFRWNPFTTLLIFPRKSLHPSVPQHSRTILFCRSSTTTANTILPPLVWRKTKYLFPDIRKNTNSMIQFTNLNMKNVAWPKTTEKARWYHFFLFSSSPNLVQNVCIVMLAKSTTKIIVM